MLWIFFRKGILKSKRPTGMSLCCFFTETSGFPGLLATFILTDGMDGMGWMGWDGMDGMGWDGMDGMVGPLFFLAHILKTTS